MATLELGKSERLDQLVAHGANLGEVDDLLAFLERLLESDRVIGKPVETELLDFFEKTLVSLEAWERLEVLYRKHSTAATTPHDLQKWIQKLYDIHANRRPDDAAAYEVAKQVVVGNPDSGEWRERLVSHALKAGMRNDLFEFLDTVASSDGVCGTELEATYRTVVEETLTRLEEWGRLLAIYQKRAETTSAVKERIAWLEKVHRIQAHHQKDESAAFETCKALATLELGKSERLDQLVAHGANLGEVDDLLAFLERLLESDRVIGKPVETELLDFFEKTLVSLEAWERLEVLYRKHSTAATTPHDLQKWIQKLYDIHANRRPDDAAAYEVAKQVVVGNPDSGEWRERLVSHALKAGMRNDLFEFLDTVASSDGVCGTELEATYRTVVEETLTRLEEWGRLLAIYQKRAETTSAVKERIAWLEKVHRIQAHHQKDESAAFETCKALVTLDPCNSEIRSELLAYASNLNRGRDLVTFLEDLRDSDPIAGSPLEADFTTLIEQTLKGLEDWDGLSALYGMCAEKASVPEDKKRWLDSLYEVHRLHRVDEAAAYAVCKRLIEVSPSDFEHRDRLVQHADKLDQLDDLIRFLESTAGASQIAGTEVEADYRAFLEATLADRDEWDRLADYCTRMADVAETAGEKVSWLARIYTIRARRQNNEAAAYSICRELLSLEPTNAERRHQLVAHAMRLEKGRDLVAFLEGMLGVEGMSGTELETDYRKTIEEILSDQEDWGSLLESYTSRADGAETKSERLDWLGRIYAIHARRQPNETAAFDICKQLLSLEPDNIERRNQLVEHAMRLEQGQELVRFLEQLMKEGVVSGTELEADYRTILEEILAELGDWSHLVALYEGLSEAAESDQDRSTWLGRLYAVYASRLQDEQRAYETGKQLLALSLDEGEIRRRVLSHAVSLGTTDDYQAFLEKTLAAMKSDKELQARCWLEIGATLEKQAEDLEGAVRQFEASLGCGQTTSTQDAVARLRALYPALKKWDKYIALLQQLAGEASEEERRSCLQEAARAAISLGDSKKAHSILKELATELPDDDTVFDRYEQVLLDSGRTKEWEAAFRTRIQRFADGRTRAGLRLRFAEQLLETTESFPEGLEQLLTALGEDGQAREVAARLVSIVLDSGTPDKSRLELARLLEEKHASALTAAELKKVSGVRVSLEPPPEVPKPAPLPEPEVEVSPRPKKAPLPAGSPPPIPQKAAPPPVPKKAAPPPVPKKAVPPPVPKKAVPPQLPQKAAPPPLPKKAVPPPLPEKAETPVKELAAPEPKEMELAEEAPIVEPEEMRLADLAQAAHDEEALAVADPPVVLPIPERPAGISRLIRGLLLGGLGGVVFVAVVALAASQFGLFGWGGDSDSNDSKAVPERKTTPEVPPEPIVAEPGVPEDEETVAEKTVAVKTQTEGEHGEERLPPIDSGHDEKLPPVEEKTEEKSVEVEVPPDRQLAHKVHVLTAQGRNLLALERYNEAIGRFEDALKLTDNKAPLVELIGMARSSMRKQAEQLTQEGRNALSHGEYDKALQSFGRALEYGGDEVELQLLVSSAKAKKVAQVMAEEEAEEHKTIDEEAQRTAMAAEDARRQAEKDRKAREQKEARRKAKEEAGRRVVVSSKGETSEVADPVGDDEEERLEEVERRVQKAAEDTRKGTTALELERYDVALKYFDAATEFSGTTPALKTLIAKAHEGQKEAARRATAKYYRSSAIDAMDMGDYSSAVSDLKKAQGYGDSSAEVDRLIGKCKKKLKKKEDSENQKKEAKEKLEELDLGEDDLE